MRAAASCTSAARPDDGARAADTEADPAIDHWVTCFETAQSSLGLQYLDESPVRHIEVDAVIREMFDFLTRYSRATRTGAPNDSVKRSAYTGCVKALRAWEAADRAARKEE